MCFSGRSKKVLETLMSMQVLTRGIRESKGQVPNGEYFPEAAMLSDTDKQSWVETILPYQICSAISNQRHKRHMLNISSNLYKKYGITPEFISLTSTVDTSKGGPVIESGGRLGKLDSATEAGMFHKINKNKLEKLKKTLKDKPDEKKAPADPAAKSEE